MATTVKLANWRHSPSDKNGEKLPAVEQLDLVDITLLTQVAGEPYEVPHLGLHFDGRGVSVLRWDGVFVAMIPWASLRQLRTKVKDQKGSAGDVELEVESDRKTHHFLVSNVHPDALKDSLTAMSARHARNSLVESAPRRSFRLR